MFNKKGVFWYLGLTFGLTLLIDLIIYFSPAGFDAASSTCQGRIKKPALNLAL